MKWEARTDTAVYAKHTQILIAKGSEEKYIYQGPTPDAWLQENLERLARSYAIHLNGIERRRRGGPARVK